MVSFLHGLMKHAFLRWSVDSFCSHKCHISVVSSLHELMTCAYSKSISLWTETYKFHIWKISFPWFPFFIKSTATNGIKVITDTRSVTMLNVMKNSSKVCHATYHPLTMVGIPNFFPKIMRFRMLQLDFFRL